MLCLGLPWALFRYFSVSSKTNAHFTQKNTQFEKLSLNWKIVLVCVRKCQLLSRRFPLMSRRCPLIFHGSKLAKSCQVKVFAHFMFVRAESETSNKVPIGLRSDQPEDLGMLVISFGEVHDGKSSTLCDKRNCVDFEVGPCLVRQRQQRRNNHRCIGSVQPWASSRCVDGHRGTSRLAVGWLMSLMNSKHLTPAQPSMPQWSQPDVAADSFDSFP